MALKLQASVHSWTSSWVVGGDVRRVSHPTLRPSTIVSGHSPFGLGICPIPAGEYTTLGPFLCPSGFSWRMVVIWACGSSERLWLNGHLQCLVFGPTAVLWAYQLATYLVSPSGSPCIRGLLGTGLCFHRLLHPRPFRTSVGFSVGDSGSRFQLSSRITTYLKASIRLSVRITRR